MFILWMGLNIAMAEDFAITESAQLNTHQQHFIATVNQNRVRYKKGFQRYKSRTYKRHWTYSRGKTYTEIEQKLQTAANTDVFYLEGSRSKEYTANALVVLPELNVVTPKEWHRLLEQTPETLLVGDVSQEILENCSGHDSRPKNLYITGERSLTNQLRTCFPNTTLVIEGVRSIEPEHGETFAKGRLSRQLIVSKNMDADSADILKGFTRSVVILGDRLPKWFDSVYADSTWDSVHLSELTSINIKTATSLMAKPDGKVHLDGITTIKEGVTTILTGTEAHHLEELAIPNLDQVSPQSLSHLTKHIETVSVGPIPWTAKEVRVIQGTSGHIISYGTEVMTEKATDLLFRRRDREGRSFHFVQAKISDPKVLEKVGSLQYFLGLHRSLPNKGDAKIVVDFTFDEWNMGLISQLDPLPKGSNYFTVDIAEETLRAFTSWGGFSLGGTKPLEVMKAIAEDEELWYVHDCSMLSDCFSFWQDGITKEYIEYLVNNYGHLKLGGSFTNEALEVLTTFKGSLGIHMEALTQEQAAILAKGSFSKLSMGFEETTLAALQEFMGYTGELSLPAELHHNRKVQHIMLATGQIDSPSRWEPKSLMYLNQVSLEEVRIDTHQALTADQLRSVAQFEGRLYLDLKVRQILDEEAEQIPQYKVTQQMLDILATSKAKSLTLWLPVSDHLDWSALSQYKQTLSIYAGPGRPEWFEPIVSADQLHLYPTVTPNLLKLVDQYQGPELNLGSFVLTDALAQRMVKQSYAIGVSALDVEPAAIKTLLAATHKENMSVETSATSELCWAHIHNSICYTDIWDVYEEEDTGNY